MSAGKESLFTFTEFMEAWGELRAAVLRELDPERLAAEPYAEQHLDDLRAKLRAMERQIAGLVAVRRNPTGADYGGPEGPGHQHHRARDGRQA